MLLETVTRAFSIPSILRKAETEITLTTSIVATGVYATCIFYVVTNILSTRIWSCITSGFSLVYILNADTIQITYFSP